MAASWRVAGLVVVLLVMAMGLSACRGQGSAAIGTGASGFYGQGSAGAGWR